MKITTEEIYELAGKITEKEIDNVLGGWRNEGNIKELNLFKTLIKLGDSRAIALFTVIAERYNAEEASEIYQIAYYS